MKYSLSKASLNLPNPYLFINGDNMTDYYIGDTVPSGNWIKVNRFCSILSTLWLFKKKYSDFYFSDLSDLEIDQAVKTLVSFESMKDKSEYAKSILKGTYIDFEIFSSLISASKALRFWVANDRQCMALVISDKYIIFYDPNLGDIQYFQTKNQLLKYLKLIECNIFIKI